MDPKAFKIIDGKLYLNWSPDLADQFEADAPNDIRKADATWKELTHER